jgi:DNA processing protein
LDLSQVVSLYLYGNTKKAIEAIPELSRRRGGKVQPASEASAQREYEKLTQIGRHFIASGSDGYPEHLKNFDDSPFILSCLGHMHLLKKPTLSIIGARNASLKSCKYTERISSELGEQGYVVISGMARGIDRSAHQGA